MVANSFIKYNKQIARDLGVNEAVLFGELSSQQDFYNKKTSFQKGDGFFFATQAALQEQTGLSKFQQTAAVSKLVKSGLLLITQKGLPRTLHYKINVKKCDIKNEAKREVNEASGATFLDYSEHNINSNIKENATTLSKIFEKKEKKNREEERINNNACEVSSLFSLLVTQFAEDIVPTIFRKTAAFYKQDKTLIAAKIAPILENLNKPEGWYKEYFEWLAVQPFLVKDVESKQYFYSLIQLLSDANRISDFEESKRTGVQVAKTWVNDAGFLKWGASRYGQSFEELKNNYNDMTSFYKYLINSGGYDSDMLRVKEHNYDLIVLDVA